MAVAVVIVMLLLVMAPLAYSSLKVFRSQSVEQVGSSATTKWLTGSTYERVTATADDDAFRS